MKPNEAARNVRRTYWKIDSVVLAFGPVPARDLPNTLLLRVENTRQDWSTPFVARPMFIEARGKSLPVTILRPVWIDIWSSTTMPREQALAKLAAAAAAGTSVVLDQIAFTTQFGHAESISAVEMVGPVNALGVLEKLNELNWMQVSGYRPAWYRDLLHGEAFAAFEAGEAFNPAQEIQDHVAFLFSGPPFERRLKADALLQQLDGIPKGSDGATSFHKWVAEAIELVFAGGLEEVRVNPNKKAVEQRDIVARNVYGTRFWKRLLVEYKVSMPVFEAKNYSVPGSRDFRQVHAYLAQPHHGDLGFIVARKRDYEMGKNTLKHFRHYYGLHGLRKLIIVLPSALLAELLVDVVNHRDGAADGKMASWLEKFLLEHIYE